MANTVRIYMKRLSILISFRLDIELFMEIVPFKSYLVWMLSQC